MTKQYKMGELFTDAELQTAAKICAVETTPNKRLVAEVVAPVLPRINETTGQENSAQFIAYALEFALTRKGAA